MDAVPEPEAFLPAGLATYTAANEDVPADVLLTRVDMCGDPGLHQKQAGIVRGDIAQPPADRLVVFQLFTIDVRDTPAIAIPPSAYASEAAIQEIVREHDETLNLRAGAYEDAEQARVQEARANRQYGARALEFQAVESSTVYLTGQLLSGAKIGIVFPYRPTLEVQVPMVGKCTQEMARSGFARVMQALAAFMRLPASAIRCVYHMATYFNGYIPASPSNPLERKQFLFASVSFPTRAHMIRGGMLLRQGFGYDANRVMPMPLVCEDRIDVEQKVVDAMKLQPFGWHVLDLALAGVTVVEAHAPHYMLVDEEIRLPMQSAQMSYIWSYDALPEGSATPTLPLHPEVYKRLSLEQRAVVMPPLVDGPTHVAPIHVASIDIEVTSRKGSFPNARRATDAVVVVCIVFAYGGGCPRRWQQAMAARVAGAEVAAEDGCGGASGAPDLWPNLPRLDFKECLPYERQAFVLGKCDPIEGVIVRQFTTEEDLIAEVRHELMVRKRVDIIMGHNIVGFDISYLAGRVTRGGAATMHSPGRAFMRLGAIAAETLELTTKQAAKALGATKLSTINGAGFAYIDTLLICKEVHKLPLNGLNAVAQRFLGQQKYDMPLGLISDVVRDGTPSHWRKLTAYCVQDCQLPLALLALWDTVKDSASLSQVMHTPLAVATRSGVQVRVRNPLMKRARLPHFNMVMNGVNEPRMPGQQFAPNVAAKGGLVLDSKQGLYLVPVAVLDFGSLYPSIMETLMLCWSTVIDPAIITQEHIDAGLKVMQHKTNLGTYTIVTNVPAVCVEQLRVSGKEREQAKARMKGRPKTCPIYQNSNNRQNQLKKWRNSTYGAANAAEGSAIMPCKALGTVTCGTGRLMNMEAHKVILDTFPGVNVVYGDTDSLMVVFPEPPEIAAACDKRRLQYSRDQGLLAQHAINDHFKAKYGHDVMKVELEKIYMPALFCGKGGDANKAGGVDSSSGERKGAKKTYTGVHYALNVIDKVTDDLKPSDPATGVVGGFIECKGMRAVRRDVPAFVRGMVDKLLHALFFDRSEDRFWDIVHTYVEDICFQEGEMASLDAFVSTAEVSYNYKGQPAAHVAVAYAREYNMPGAAFAEGSRVPFVMVEELDRRRVIRPPWFVAAEDGSLDTDASAQKHAAMMGETMGVGDVHTGASAYGRGTGGSGSSASHGSAVAGGSGSNSGKHASAGNVAPKDSRAMCARHPDEVLEDPEHNHLDIMHYIQQGICTVLKQLMPAAEAEQRRIIEYAKSACHILRERRQMQLLRRGNVMGKFLSVQSSESANECERSTVRSLLAPLPHRRTAPVSMIPSKRQSCFASSIVSVKDEDDVGSESDNDSAGIDKGLDDADRLTETAHSAIAERPVATHVRHVSAQPETRNAGTHNAVQDCGMAVALLHRGTTPQGRWHGREAGRQPSKMKPKPSLSRFLQKVQANDED